ncbi:Uncharacterised protein [Corynebacterium ulcerans]|nr:Uncharacterised protein [Corynebacterium ulcerans]
MGRRSAGNYLRIRGEKAFRLRRCQIQQELPPHTRRKVNHHDDRDTSKGTASAYAEKRETLIDQLITIKNYLRIRGEKAPSLFRSSPLMELPPHTRRKASSFLREFATVGTTSAYAEKSGRQLPARHWHRNYLRIRGEKAHRRLWQILGAELPPHTRRKVVLAWYDVPESGTTSAYAEKRKPTHYIRIKTWNYLRIRGEKGSFEHYRPADWELPPHTRRKVW